MYQTKITEIGNLVEEFREEVLLVLFGPKVPPELKDISVIHESNKEPKDIFTQNGKIKIGNQVYTITKVGTEANKNFESLGHISIYFREGENEVLPGAINVTPQVFPELQVGNTIDIY
ncbi:PTS sorbitol transporter subunit IIA [Tetragenococcus halophilus subsp. flandriensis]|uniref:PTS glucitol/sorbitol transporter subunit IIA n=1 Tax=Tetragenococcus halophilus TaxID=51669 RepID=UPI0023E95289|nr:PTS glucitol/sorbitol transporter subunit IIA [Tetragenococcus halophilus]GMA09325.1 PTS sorbitol transporter subunit IIA [Tetragenococcus halophilus subsp. flandriensis]